MKIQEKRNADEWVVKKTRKQDIRTDGYVSGKI